MRALQEEVWGHASHHVVDPIPDVISVGEGTLAGATGPRCRNEAQDEGTLRRSTEAAR
jgi:hypothetical protein